MVFGDYQLNMIEEPDEFNIKFWQNYIIGPSSLK